jgi:hypothetical protein
VVITSALKLPNVYRKSKGYARSIPLYLVTELVINIFYLFILLPSSKGGRLVHVVYLTLLAPHHFGFESRQGLCFFFMSGSHPASLHNMDGSTQVPVCTQNNAQKDT